MPDPLTHLSDLFCVGYGDVLSMSELYTSPRLKAPLSDGRLEEIFDINSRLADRLGSDLFGRLQHMIADQTGAPA